MPSCIYRILNTEHKPDLPIPFGGVSTTSCLPNCRILVENGLKNTECQNEDLTEFLCPVSPTIPAN